jgi:non-specific serine/threonine protein kinase
MAQPATGAVAVQNNLPFQLTSFIGREREIAEVERLLGTTRLLTLTGTGGCGKTRLALEVAARILPKYEDGVWLVELAALSDAGLVAQTVATALAVREAPGQALGDTLAAYLRDRSLLLVLDNCEHLVVACARLAEALLRAAPGLHILATSREPLAVGGETTWRVPSLAVPGIPVPAEPERLTRYEAVRLFVERARSSAPAFGMTSENAPAVARICARLDGIPLAIELAASRVRVLPPEEIAVRLDDRFRLLAHGNRAALPRQQTLRALIDWSHDLLDDDERALLRRLSVFGGGFDARAAEAVCAGDGLATAEVLDVLFQLVDKSLVLVEVRDGASHYRLLETIRQYAREKLGEAGEPEHFRDAHLDYYLRFVGEAVPHLRGQSQMAWFNRLISEYDNLLAALEWAKSRGDRVEKGLQLAGGLYWFWYMRGYAAEARKCLEELLAQPAASAGEIRRSKARADALTTLSKLAQVRADYAAVPSSARESLEIYRQLSDKAGISLSLNHLAFSAVNRGDLATARGLYEQSVACGRELDDPEPLAYALWYGGYVAYRQEDYAAAEAFGDECLALYRTIGNRSGYALALLGRGMTALEKGDYGTAQGLLDESLAVYRELGSPVLIAGALNQVGVLARRRGDHGRAAEAFRESLEAASRMGSRQNIAVSLGGLAGAAAAGGQAERAARLLGAAEALYETIGVVFTPNERAVFDRDVAAARAGLSEESFAAAWADGRQLPLERAIRLALETPAAVAEPVASSPPHSVSASAYPSGLTEREVEVLRPVARGLTSARVAEQLVISPVTVNTHLHNIYGKIGVNSRTAAAKFAIENGLV